MSGTRFRMVLRSALFGLAVVLSHPAVAGELTDAVSANDLAQVNSLLAGGADVNAPSRSGTALHIASGAGATEIMAALIAAGADIEAEGPAGFRPLHLAAKKNQPAAVKLLIEHGAKVDSRDSFGFTPLMVALDFPPEGFDAAEVLIASGADLNAQDRPDRWTALHWAADKGRVEVARFLIARGADINARGVLDATPLHAAVIHHRLEMIGFLVASGADVNARNKNGETPIDLARGNAEAFRSFQQP